MRAQQLAELALEDSRSGHFGQAERELRQAVALDPDNPRFLGNLGAILGAEGKLQDAGVYLGKALTMDPNNVVLRRDLAATELNLGEESQAQRNLEYILKRRPGDGQDTVLLGVVTANMREYEKALALFESVPALAREQPQAVAALARCYYRVGQTPKARQALLVLLKTPQDPQGVFLGAQVAEQELDGPTAVRLFDSIRSTYPNSFRLEYHLAHAEYESGQCSESQNLLEQLIHSGHGTSEALNLVGRCYAVQGKIGLARQALETAITLRPSQEANYSDLTAILLTHKQVSAALVAAKLWTKRFPSSYRAVHMGADIDMRLQFYQQAASSYQQAIHLRPSSQADALGVAEAEAAAGVESRAEVAFQTGIRRFPKNEPLYREYGRTLLQESKQGSPGAKERAAAMLETAVRLDSSDWKAQYLLGNLWVSDGKASRALPELIAAARLSPKETKVRFALWRAYNELGMHAQASRQLQIIRQLQRTAPQTKAISDVR